MFFVLLLRIFAHSSALHGFESSLSVHPYIFFLKVYVFLHIVSRYITYVHFLYVEVSVKIILYNIYFHQINFKIKRYLVCPRVIAVSKKRASFALMLSLNRFQNGFLVK